MPINRPTAIAVKKSKAPGLYADGANLCLQLTKNPNGKPFRSWIFRYKSPVSGKERRMGLGPTNLIGLEEARLLRDENRRLLRQGIDPLDHRDARKAEAAKAVKSVVTFDAAAAAYVKAHSAASVASFIVLI